ncbi:hypothetical protein FB451DRAFT_1041829, partial [Mycena latifolia]
VNINTKVEHVHVCRWVTITIILHNIVIKVERGEFTKHFSADHGAAQEQDD